MLSRAFIASKTWSPSKKKRHEIIRNIALVPYLFVLLFCCCCQQESYAFISSIDYSGFKDNNAHKFHLPRQSNARISTFLSTFYPKQQSIFWLMNHKRLNDDDYIGDRLNDMNERMRSRKDKQSQQQRSLKTKTQSFDEDRSNIWNNIKLEQDTKQQMKKYVYDDNDDSDDYDYYDEDDSYYYYEDDEDDNKRSMPNKKQNEMFNQDDLTDDYDDDDDIYDNYPSTRRPKKPRGILNNIFEEFNNVVDEIDMEIWRARQTRMKNNPKNKFYEMNNDYRDDFELDEIYFEDENEDEDEDELYDNHNSLQKDISSWFTSDDHDNNVDDNEIEFNRFFENDDNPIDLLLDKVFNIDTEERKRLAEAYDDRMGISPKKTTRKYQNDEITFPINENNIDITHENELDELDELIVNDSNEVIDVNATTTFKSSKNSKSSDILFATELARISQKTKPKIQLTWKERAEQVDRIPPSGIAAWGPNGEVQDVKDAQEAAVLIAKEEIKESEDNTQLFIEKVEEVREQVILLQADARLLQKRCKSDEYEQSRYLSELQQIEGQLSRASRRLRHRLNVVKEAQAEEVRLKKKHWALLSQFELLKQ